MYFITFVLKNVLRRPLRSTLTILAIAIAVGAVVALVGVSAGFEKSFLDIYTEMQVDLLVVRKGGRERLSSALDESLGPKIESIAGVKQVIPGLVDAVSFEDYNMYAVILQGWTPETAAFSHLKMLSGRKLLRTDGRAAILGKNLAQSMEKNVGDTIDIVEGEPFEVVGIYETNNVYEDGALVVPLVELQRLMGREGQVTGFSVVLTDSTDEALLNRVRSEVETIAPRISALTTKEQVDSLQQIQMVRAMAWITSAVALFIGAVGIMNTMVMAVSERTREIGVLRAIGWRQGRVVQMVLSEAIVLSLFGAIVGAVGAVALVGALTRVPLVAGFIDGKIPAQVILQGFGIAMLVGLLGGMLPAFRAARMLPTSALRHE